MNRSKNYESPLTECWGIVQEKNFCKSDLSTATSNGLEGFTEDAEQGWDY